MPACEGKNKRGAREKTPRRKRQRVRSDDEEVEPQPKSHPACIDALPFHLLVLHIIHRFTGEWLPITPAARERLQEAAEAYLEGLFADAGLLAFHAGRLTVRPIDLQLTERLRGLPRLCDWRPHVLP